MLNLFNNIVFKILGFLGLKLASYNYEKYIKRESSVLEIITHVILVSLFLFPTVDKLHNLSHQIGDLWFSFNLKDLLIFFGYTQDIVLFRPALQTVKTVRITKFAKREIFLSELLKSNLFDYVFSTFDSLFNRILGSYSKTKFSEFFILFNLISYLEGFLEELNFVKKNYDFQNSNQDQDDSPRQHVHSHNHLVVSEEKIPALLIISVFMTHVLGLSLMKFNRQWFLASKLKINRYLKTELKDIVLFENYDISLFSEVLIFLSTLTLIVFFNRNLITKKIKNFKFNIISTLYLLYTTFYNLLTFFIIFSLSSRLTITRLCCSRNFKSFFDLRKGGLISVLILLSGLEEVLELVTSLIVYLYKHKRLGTFTPLWHKLYLLGSDLYYAVNSVRKKEMTSEFIESIFENISRVNKDFKDRLKNSYHKIILETSNVSQTELIERIKKLIINVLEIFLYLVSHVVEHGLKKIFLKDWCYLLEVYAQLLIYIINIIISSEEHEQH